MHQGTLGARIRVYAVSITLLGSTVGVMGWLRTGDVVLTGVTLGAAPPAVEQVQGE